MNMKRINEVICEKCIMRMMFETKKRNFMCETNKNQTTTGTSKAVKINNAENITL